MSTPELSRTNPMPPPEDTWHSKDYVDYYDRLTSAGRRKDGQALATLLGMAVRQMTTATTMPHQATFGETVGNDTDFTQAAHDIGVVEHHRAYLSAAFNGDPEIPKLSAGDVESMYTYLNDALPDSPPQNPQ